MYIYIYVYIYIPQILVRLKQALLNRWQEWDHPDLIQSAIAILVRRFEKGFHLLGVHPHGPAMIKGLP